MCLKREQFGKKLSRNVSLFWELFDYTETETKRIITTVPYPTSAKAFFDQIIPVEEMFYLTMHLTHFIYGYMAWGIW